MKRPKFKRGGGIYARLNRIEARCNYIISRLDAHTHAPRQDEIDSIVANLRDTAKAMAAGSQAERIFFANRYDR